MRFSVEQVDIVLCCPMRFSKRLTAAFAMTIAIASIGGLTAADAVGRCSNVAVPVTEQGGAKPSSKRLAPSTDSHSIPLLEISKIGLRVVCSRTIVTGWELIS